MQTQTPPGGGNLDTPAPSHVVFSIPLALNHHHHHHRHHPLAEARVCLHPSGSAGPRRKRVRKQFHTRSSSGRSRCRQSHFSSLRHNSVKCDRADIFRGRKEISLSLCTSWLNQLVRKKNNVYTFQVAVEKIEMRLAATDV